MIAFPYRFRSRRAATWRDWLLLAAAGITTGAILFYSIT